MTFMRAILFTVIYGLLINGIAFPMRVWAAEGEEQLRITAIEIRGNEKISDRDILSVMRGRAGEPFNLATLLSDLTSIENMGWFSATPEHALESFQGGVKIIIVVKENPAFKGVEITQVGPGVFPKATLVMFFDINPGEIINNNSVMRGLAAIERQYREKGYTAATITESSIRNDGVIVIEVTEGVIADIVLQGNTKTKSHVIMREISIKPGDVFNAIIFRRDLERVYNLQLFEDIQPSFEINNNRQVILYINVKEAKTGQVGFGAGYSSNDGLMATVNYSERNLRGTGQRLSAMGQVGGPNPDFNVSFYNPVIDSQKTSFSIEGFLFNESSRLRNPDDPDKVWPFDLERKGGSMGFVRPFSETLSLALSLKVLDGSVTFYDADGNVLPPDKITDIGDNLWIENGLIDGESNSLTSKLAYDTRDFSLDPSRGMVASLQCGMIGHLLGGDFDAFKYELEYRYFLPLTEVEPDVGELSPQRGKPPHVFAFRVLYRGSSGELPLIERYEIGGQYTVRGTDETAQSGDRAFLFNTEYRFPLGGKLGGALFFDAGTAAAPGSPLNWGDMISTIGIGVRYRIPFFGVAPIRLDYGYDLATKNGEIVFGIGQLF